MLRTSFIHSVWCDFLCLKYYRVPKYRMRYVIIVFVERMCTGCKKLMIFTLGNYVYLQKLNGITLCVMFVNAMFLTGTQNSERVKCVEYKLLLPPVREENGEMLVQKLTLKIQTST